MAEHPWPSGPVEAMLKWDGGVQPEDGSLWFRDPEGQMCRVSVSPGPTRQDRIADNMPGQNVWHVEVNDDLATVSPSIWFKGHFHTTNPVRFRLVEVESVTELVHRVR